MLLNIPIFSAYFQISGLQQGSLKAPLNSFILPSRSTAEKFHVSTFQQNAKVCFQRIWKAVNLVKLLSLCRVMLVLLKVSVPWPVGNKIPTFLFPKGNRILSWINEHMLLYYIRKCFRYSMKGLMSGQCFDTSCLVSKF